MIKRIRGKKKEKIYYLIKKQRHRITVRGPGGSTLLHLAAFYDKHECVSALLARGADVDPLDDDKCTPLHYLYLVLIFLYLF